TPQPRATCSAPARGRLRSNSRGPTCSWPDSSREKRRGQESIPKRRRYSECPSSRPPHGLSLHIRDSDPKIREDHIRSSSTGRVMPAIALLLPRLFSKLAKEGPSR